MNKLLSIIVSCLLISVPFYTISSEISLSTLDKARNLMITAQSKFLKPGQKMTADQFEDIIYTQSGIIAHEEEKINNEDIIVKPKKTTPDSYALSLRKALMAWSGYEVTDEQKKARKELDILLEQKKIVEDNYDLVDVEDITDEGKKRLKERYAHVINRIDNDLYHQQVAIGSRWSLLKKAIVAVSVAAAATVAGWLFTNKWWGVENK